MADKTSARPIRDHVPQTSKQTAATKSSKRARKRKPYRSPTRRFVTALVKIALLAYATIVVAVVLMEPRLVYPGAYIDSAERELPTNSPELGRIEVVEYPSSNGLTLRGRLLERSDTNEFVLYFHGNGASAGHLDAWLRALSQRLDATVMIAEYRGYADDVTPTEQGVIADCFAARDYLCRRFERKPDEIILYGQSLGGGCAVAVASFGGAKALILDRTFDRMVEVAARRYAFLPVRFLMRNRYDSIAKITAYDGPLIQLHGTADATIPIEHGRKLFEAAPTDVKHFIEVKGLEHNDPVPSEAFAELVDKLRQFTTLSTIPAP